LSEYADALQTLEAVLGRKPTADEVTAVLKLVDAGQADKIGEMFSEPEPEIDDDGVGIWRFEAVGDGVQRIQ